MLTDEQKSRLNPEQLVIAEKWEQESIAQGKAIEMMRLAEAANDAEGIKKAFEAFLNASDTSGFCEHERSIWTPCMACEEIERLLNPEFYDEDGERLPEEVIEELILKREKEQDK